MQFHTDGIVHPKSSHSHHLISSCPILVSKARAAHNTARTLTPPYLTSGRISRRSQSRQSYQSSPSSQSRMLPSSPRSGSLATTARPNKALSWDTEPESSMTQKIKETGFYHTRSWQRPLIRQSMSSVEHPTNSGEAVHPSDPAYLSPPTENPSDQHSPPTRHWKRSSSSNGSKRHTKRSYPERVSEGPTTWAASRQNWWTKSIGYQYTDAQGALRGAERRSIVRLSSSAQRISDVLASPPSTSLQNDWTNPMRDHKLEGANHLESDISLSTTATPLSPQCQRTPEALPLEAAQGAPDGPLLKLSSTLLASSQGRNTESVATASSPTSSIRYNSDDNSPRESIETPLTSPCLSSSRCHAQTPDSSDKNLSMYQLDGALGPSGDRVAEPETGNDAEHGGRSEYLLSGQGLSGDHTTGEARSQASSVAVDLQQPCERSRPDLAAHGLDVSSHRSSETPIDDLTPMADASRAKEANSFPFPCHDGTSLNLLSTQRHPSALLRHCERSATPRQRQSMAGVLQTPDRFIPPRRSTPTKEKLLLSKPAVKRLEISSRGPQQSRQDTDPFGPLPSRNSRTNDRFATTRRPALESQTTSSIGSRLSPDGLAINRRAISTGAVWSVGGTIVTEGVASVTDGRGGRVTSGTNAPHHTSDFLRRQSPSEEEVVHGQRLALAMNIDESTGLFKTPSSASSTTPSSRRSFSDSGNGRRAWMNNA